MSDTPRTDAVYKRAFHASWPDNLNIMTAHAKTQERELAEAGMLLNNWGGIPPQTPLRLSSQ